MTFLLETLKNPLSAPALILIQLIILVFILFKLKLEIIKEYIGKLQELSPKKKYQSVGLVIVSTLIFFFSTFLIFYKMTDIPAGSFEADDGGLITGAYIIKNLGHDSIDKVVPYYPYFYLHYHNERASSFGQRGVPLYYQSFLQFFVKPGFFSLRLECTLLMFFASVILVYTLYLLTRNVSISILGGSLFNLMPWTRVLARVTPETTAYCFASTCFLFSIFYLINKRGFWAFIFYLVSLSMLFLSYAPGLLLAPLCVVVLYLIVKKFSTGDKRLSNLILLWGLFFLGLLYFEFQDEGGFKESLSRAQNAQGLEGLANFDLGAIFNNFLNKANVYLANYFGYLLPQFLFFTGDSNLRHNSGFGGQLFVSLIIAFYIGIFYLAKKRKENLNLLILLVYLLISNVPASICLEGSLDSSLHLPLHALRSSCMLPTITIIIVLGLIEIFNKQKNLFYLYLVLITFNVQGFYNDYFNTYPKRLGRSFDDPGLKDVARKAIQVLKENPEKKLFYSSPFITVPYHNLEEIGINALINGSGLLSNVYHFEEKGSLEPQYGDLILVHEPWHYEWVTKKFGYILRVRNPNLPDNNYGASLFEIIE